MRVGYGYDVHCFDTHGVCRLGGVDIPGVPKLKAHSDGDALIHALCDALLGAMAEGDIGQHFPDSDSKYQDINSRHLLRLVVEMMNEKGFVIENIDTTIIAQKPKIAPHVHAMRQALAEDLHIDMTQVNVKGTTTEGLGYIGREEGIAAVAVVLLSTHD